MALRSVDSRRVLTSRYALISGAAQRSDDVLLYRQAKELGLTEWDCRELRSPR
jgi:hypothetical protein